jgi:hypothetical protein
MKKTLTIFSLLLILSSSLYSQSSIVIDETANGIRNFYSIKINSSSQKNVFIQQNTIPGPTGNTGGNFFKLNTLRNGWNQVNYLNAPCCPSGSCYPIDNIVQSRTNPDVMIFNGLYVCGSDSNDYTKITYNGGATTVNLPFGGVGNMGQECRGFDIDPTNHNIMYMAHTVYNGVYHPQPRIFKSTNAGVNWFVIDTLAGMKKMAHPWITGATWGGFLKICPWNPQIIITVTDDHIAYTLNGQDFTVRNDVTVMKLLVYDEGDGMIHGISFDNKIYCNNGNVIGNWIPTTAPYDIKNIEINPDDHNYWYGGSDNGVYRSTNWGLTWSLYNNSFLPSRKIIGVAKDANVGDTIVVATDKKVYKVWAPLIVNVPTLTSINPDAYSLSQNYPNPFNPITKINYSVKNSGFVSIKVYDVLGNEAAVLVNENQTAGSYLVNFDGSELTSGIYFYTMIAGNYTESKKMLLVK